MRMYEKKTKVTHHQEVISYIPPSQNWVFQEWCASPICYFLSLSLKTFSNVFSHVFLLHWCHKVAFPSKNTIHLYSKRICIVPIHSPKMRSWHSQNKRKFLHENFFGHDTDTQKPNANFQRIIFYLQHKRRHNLGAEVITSLFMTSSSDWPHSLYFPSP